MEQQARTVWNLFGICLESVWFLVVFGLSSLRLASVQRCTSPEVRVLSGPFERPSQASFSRLAYDLHFGVMKDDTVLGDIVRRTTFGEEEYTRYWGELSDRLLAPLCCAHGNCCGFVRLRCICQLPLLSVLVPTPRFQEPAQRSFPHETVRQQYHGDVLQLQVAFEAFEFPYSAVPATAAKIIVL